MHDDKLQKAIQECIERGRQLATAPRTSAGQDELRGKFEAAASSLETEIKGRLDAGQSFRTILVAVDHREQAEWALTEAVRLCQALGGRLSIIHVVDIASPTVAEFAFDERGWPTGLLCSANDFVKAMMDKVPAAIRGAQIVREGKPDVQIIEAANELHPDLIVVGTGGAGIIRKLLIGSVASSVIRHSPCPVLTISHRQPESPVGCQIGHLSDTKTSIAN